MEVEGWGRLQGYLAAGARIPRRVDAAALIGPFDSLIWERTRVERIFGFSYRLEIYVPAPKRATATTYCRCCSATGSSRAST